VTAHTDAKKPSQRGHRWLYALPTPDLPARVTCHGQHYSLLEIFKHDFFAATGLYSGPSGQVVLKLGRTNPLATVPATWLGAFLARRERKLYELTQDLPGIPRYIGPVGETGFLHEFIPGHPLGRREVVSDTFFDELAALLSELHRRHVAYVDLNKRENILVGDDGRPYLIDFQISLWLPPVGWRRLRPVRWFLTRFQHADVYHMLKHKRRLRPDLLTADEARRLERLSVWIRLHRRVSRPFTNLRRRTLKRLRRSEGVSVPGAAAK